MTLAVVSTPTVPHVFLFCVRLVLLTAGCGVVVLRRETAVGGSSCSTFQIWNIYVPASKSEFINSIVEIVVIN